MRPVGEMLWGKKAVLFDLDGTVLDSIGIWNETDRLLHRELTGREATEAEVQLLRDGALRRFRDKAEPYLLYCGFLAEHCRSPLTAEQVYARRSAISRRLLAEQVDYKPGADRFLLALRRAGFTLVMATTGRRSSQDVYRQENRNIMDKAPLDCVFDRIYTCEDVARIKPDPEIYLRAMAELSLPAEACLVFEDSLAGVQAAKAAGLEVCAVYDRYSDGDRQAINALADWQAASYPALMDALGLEEKETHI